MRTRPQLLDVDGLELIVAALRAGAVVGLPTDTVYGLGARLDPEAIGRVFAAKGRPPGLALPVLIGARAQLELVAASFPPAAAALADHFWPGPLTLVVRARQGVGRLVGGDGRTVGVRWPNHPLVEQVCLEVGPLAVTSANRHGEPPCVAAAEVVARFDASEVAAVLDGGAGSGAPSSVVDCSRKRPRCLREGMVSVAELEALVSELSTAG